MATLSFQMTSTPLTGTKTFTGSDADMQALLNWAQIAYATTIQQLFNPSNTPGFVPTNAQIGTALATATMNAWKVSVQQYQQTLIAPPAQMTFS